MFKSPPGYEGEDQRKALSYFWNKEGENSNFEISSEHSVLLNKSLPSRATTFSEPKRLGSYQNLIEQGEVKYHLRSPLASCLT